MNLSIIIPVYNEEENIGLLHHNLQKSLEAITSDYEMIFINDGSRDNSLDIIKGFAQKDKKVKFISFSRNFGHQIAVSAGIDHASGEAVVLIDADLQDPPELIPEMYDKLKQGFQVVYAQRRGRKGESWLKKLTAKSFYRLLSKITSISIPLDTGDFRIMDRQVVEHLKQMPEREKFLRGQISWLGFNQTSVLYDRRERKRGTTGYSYHKMMKFALDGITSFSSFPLKFATIAGFTVSFISFILIIWTLIVRFSGMDYTPGWASLMISILFLGGIQLISIGIIGEYLSRVNVNIKQRPLYIIQEKKI